MRARVPWGSLLVRRCCEEWDNPAASDQDRRLVIEWSADLRPLQVLKSRRQIASTGEAT
jgi:hypothetical protein